MSRKQTKLWTFKIHKSAKVYTASVYHVLNTISFKIDARVC